MVDSGRLTRGLFVLLRSCSKWKSPRQEDQGNMISCAEMCGKICFVDVAVRAVHGQTSRLNSFFETLSQNLLEVCCFGSMASSCCKLPIMLDNWENVEPQVSRPTFTVLQNLQSRKPILVIDYGRIGLVNIYEDVNGSESRHCFVHCSKPRIEITSSALL